MFRDYLLNGRQRSMVLVSLLLLAAMAFAVPAKPGQTRLLTLTNGSTVSATLVGDEYLHYWLGADGNAYQSAGDNVYQLFDVQTKQAVADQRRSGANQQRARRLAPRKIGSVGSITGNKKGLIILVNFSDVTFTATQSDFYKLANQVNYNEGNYKGSMYDYFYAQSDGQFRLTFDVVGPVTVSQNQAYYGGNDIRGDDDHPAEMVIEAVQLADQYVNYANYDWDGDGTVEQVYVVYAGKGEADGGSEDTIWPHEWTLSSAQTYNDGSGPQTLDGVTIDTYACGGELNGQTGAIAGIGTMCHEFSHCLGYPDFYDTSYTGGQGMFMWDLMDSGSYNGDGYQPAGYTSYERWVAGWKTPTELVYTQTISNMKALQTTGSDTYIIYNKGNKNEYYLLENRQKTGWDTSLPGAGLLILHVDYNATVWNNNKPNATPSHQRMTWIPADNQYQYITYQGSKYYTEAGAANDPFPYGSVNAFGKNTTPAATLYNNNSDGTKYLDSSVENITQNSDGTITFDFVGLTLSPSIAAEESLTFSTAVGTPKTLQLEVLTEALTQDITLTLSDASGVFSLGSTTISKDDVEATVDVTFSPTAAGSYMGSITLTSEGAETVTVQLTGTATENTPPSVVTLLYEGLSGNTTVSDGSSELATSDSSLDYSGWSSFTKVFAGGTNNAQDNGGCLKFGSSSAAGSMTTGNIALTGSGTLTFYLRQYGSDTGKLNVTVTGATADVTQFTPATDWTLCTVNLTNATGAVTITLATSAKRAYVDEIRLVGSGTTPVDPSLAYYQPADGKKGEALKTAMCDIIYNRTEQSYDDLWTAFQTTDVRSDGKIWDMYSNITNYTPVTSGSTYSVEGDCYNREHSWPKSWFGGEVMPMYTDLHHMYPTDGFVNNKRANYPFGETSNPTYTSANDFSKLGPCSYTGYNGTVFEPADEYKGDFARTYFYMVTCYEEKLHDWYTNYSSTEVTAVLDGNKYPGLSEWQLNMLMEWAKNDPVSEKETNRNNAVYNIQNNRNPFIDYPGLQEYIWGICINDEFSYDNYVEPVYKQEVTMSFSPATATATLGVDFTEPTLTTDPAGLTVTYSSSDTGVATVNASTGEVTLIAAGTTTITATFAGNDTYNSGSASYTLTVSAASTPEPADDSDIYELVTDASKLAEGDKILIAYVNGDDKYVLSTTQNNNNRAATNDVKLNADGTLTPGDAAQVITLEKNGSNFLFNVGDGYLYAASSSANQLKTTSTADDNAKATIGISSGNATITFQGANTRNIIRYNPNTSNNNPLFSCYASTSTTGSLPQIYREVQIPSIALNNSGTGNAEAITTYDKQTVCVTLAGRTLYKDDAWNTLCLPFGLSAAQIAASDLAGADIRTLSNASFTNDGTLTLNFTPESGEGAVTEITAGTPYIIKWASNSTNIVNPVFSGVTIDGTARDKVCDLDGGASIAFCGTYEKLTYDDADASILFLGEENKLYYPESGASIGAQRAYFKLEGITAKASAPGNGSGSPVRAFVLNFGDEANGISATLSDRGEMINDKWYTLDGRRLNGQPTTKGLYIHGGRKVLIK